MATGDIEIAIGLARKIESALSRRGAVGAGLREKAQSLAAHLPAGVVATIDWIARERNHVAHDEAGRLSDPAAYARACDDVLRVIEGLPVGLAPNSGALAPRPNSLSLPAAKTIGAIVLVAWVGLSVFFVVLMSIVVWLIFRFGGVR
jgi:hypothetical protein